MARADLVRDELERCGIEYLVWLPDSETRFFYDSVMASPRLRLVQVCHEEEAIGVCAGLYLAGKGAAMLVQNTGFLHSIDALLAVPVYYQLPLLMIVGYRGYHELAAGKKAVDPEALYTEPILDTLGIKHYLLDRDEDVEKIGLAYREAMATSRPVAVVVAKEYN